MRKILLAALATTALTFTGCSVEQLKSWMDLQGLDHQGWTDQQYQEGAAIATAWWEAAATTSTTARPAPQRPQLPPFLVCVRHRESRGIYTAHNYSSGASGAFQFLQTTWDNTARHAGRYDLVGIQPRWVSPLDQDLMALHLLDWYGPSPWAGPGC
jgi:uncharacterized protein RhaS with RHS repeats